MHRRPSSRGGKGSIVLPSDIYQTLEELAKKQGMSVDLVVSRFFLLGFISFDRDLYVEDGGLFRKIIYEDPRP